MTEKTEYRYATDVAKPEEAIANPTQPCATDVVNYEATGEISGQFFRSLRSLLSRTRWLEPVHAVGHITGSMFGRNIEKHVKALAEAGAQGVLAVSVRRKLKAVVITPEHYAELCQMREKLDALVASQVNNEAEDADDYFEALFARIRSEQSRIAAEELFDVTPEELARSYRPGATETGN